MKGSEIRSLFLDYFQENGHTLVPSSSLEPKDDPSLLFTNAGMVQFKGTFLGSDPRPYTRATSSQKCVRAGGKHNDLENVGYTARHHTFFEMLGNFSFGDYFKQGAIEFAWDLLVNRMGLDPDVLWVSVHTSDDEAFGLWRDKIGVAEKRIVRLGDKDNFWAMGDTGPCGPCSEIILDQGPQVGCGKPDCKLGVCDCDRYLELWNLVFMQFNRDEKGKLSPLPNPNIDTGLGLERITAILQGVKSNYETDLFEPYITFIARSAGSSYGSNPDSDTSIRVLADHARASAFLVCDGIMPSNEGRGYVLRRIIRRAARHSRLLGITKPFLHEITMQVVREMTDVYPELAQRSDFINKVVVNEEERFLKTLDRGLSMLDEIMAGLKRTGQDAIPGDELFMLYDTFGFPVDLTADIAGKEGLGIDQEGFDTQMEHQREMARSSSSFGEISLGAKTDIRFDALLEKGSEHIKFIGYDSLEAKGKVLAIQPISEKVQESGPVKTLEKGQEGLVVTDTTPFYAESGGQVGDSGFMEAPGFKAEVIETTKNESGMIMHRIKVMEGKLSKGQEVNLQVDIARRRSIMRHHSATHLLQRALREVLGDHVHQSGSLVTDARLRFDFTHFAPLSPAESQQVEDLVNEYVLANLPVETNITSKDEALTKGAMALFTEKYGDEVRMVTMGGDLSVELCGGTHCHSTGEIGLVKILSEASVSAGLRRIEAIAGMQALNHFRDLGEIIMQLSDQLKCSAQEIVQRLSSMQTRIREQENSIKELNVKIATGQGRSDEKEFTTSLGAVVIKPVGNVDIAQMRDVGDRVKEQIKSGVVLLFSSGEDKATFITMATADVGDKFNAGKFMKHAMDVVGGRGGGKALFAQGGADLNTIKRVIDIFKESSGVEE